MDTEIEDDAQIFIFQKDFMIALTKVFPSVSRKDEALYASLQHSLRKSRGQIEGNAAAAGQGNADNAGSQSHKPTTPKRGGTNGQGNPPWKPTVK